MNCPDCQHETYLSDWIPETRTEVYWCPACDVLLYAPRPPAPGQLPLPDARD